LVGSASSFFSRTKLPRIAENDKHIEDIINHSLPLGADRLLVAELVARDLRGFVENSVEVARITRQLRLPAFEFSRFAPFTWPKTR
jgi:hypothetical protein